MSASNRSQQHISNGDYLSCNGNCKSNNSSNNVSNNNNNNISCWELEDLTLFKKCGEITVSSDKQCFGLSCVFCKGICFQLDIFKTHIQEEHSQDLKDYEVDEYDLNSISKNGPQQQTHQMVPIGGNESNKVNKSNWKEVTAEVTTAATATTATTPKKTSTTPKTTTTSTTTKTTAITSTMTTLATLLSQVDFEFEMENVIENRNDLGMENIQELVYIMDEGNSVLSVEEQEETADPFQINVSGVTTATTKEPPTRKATHEKVYDLETIKSDDSLCGAEATPAVLQLDRSPKIPTRVAGGYDHEVISYLLEAYENNAKLWNPNHADYKYNAPRSVFNELATPLARDLNVDLSGAEIFGILNGLRSRYRRELTKMKASKSEGTSKLWYFDKMHFLRDVIENKRAEREMKNRRRKISNSDSRASETTSPNKPTKSVQSKEDLNYLLEAFKRREPLWNTEHADYSSCDKASLYKDISKEVLEERKIEISGGECKLEIEKLVARYRKELNALQRRKGLHIPKLWCFEQMDFLKKIFDIEFQKRKRRKKGIVRRHSRTTFNQAENFVFQNLEDQLKFVEIYKAHPALWSCEHPDFRSVKYREEAIRSVRSQFQATFNVQIESEELEKTIFMLHKAFSSEKLKRLKGVDDEEEQQRKTSPTNKIPNELYATLSTFLSSNVGPFRCDACQMIIKTSDQYKMHKSAHDGTLPFVCVLCNKGFQVPGNLAIHIRRHKRDFPYSCEQCEKSFATSTEVTIHQRVHTGARPYTCDLCGKTFKTWSFFDIHRRVHLNQSTFLCPICDKGFYEKNRYTAHMNGHLNIRKHCCKVCGKSFTTFGNLKKHGELHLPVRKYKCETCGMRFAQFASLRWHKRKKHSTDAAYDEDSVEQ